MYIIAGLGNPGREYENTRHNAGFASLDALAKRHGIEPVSYTHLLTYFRGGLEASQSWNYDQLEEAITQEEVVKVEITPNQEVPTGKMCIRDRAEAAAFYKAQGKTLWDAMVEMYERYGYYKDDIKSVSLKGIEGLQKIQEIMDTLRKNPPAQIGDYKVTSFRDYKTDTIRDLETGEVKPTGLPTSNVLYFDLTDAAWLCVRPSGTEPKVKFYYGIKGTSLEDADAKSAALGEKVLAMINEML